MVQTDIMSAFVGEPAGVNIAKSKEDSGNFMFPADTARSTAAQLLLELSYLHANGICHEGERQLGCASLFTDMTY
jgi:hypothetical protein